MREKSRNIKNRRSNNEELLGDVIKRYLKSIDRSGKYLTVQVTSSWEQLGDPINKYTKNIYFKDGVLHVSLSSAPLKAELNMNKTSLKDKLNTTIGEQAIFDIIIY